MSTRKAFEKFMEDNIDNAYRFAYTFVKNKPDAEDILSESAVKALKAIKTLKDEKYLKSWFYKIITNTAITHINRCKKVVSVDFSQCEEILHNDETNLEFFDILKDLSLQDRSIIVLKILENMKFCEIAEILKLNESTVKTRYYKALKTLKIDLEGEIYG